MPLGRRLASLVLLAPAIASGGDAKRCIDVQFQPAADKLQIVAWIAKAGSPETYYDTIYITQEVGRFGLGNRPGRFDFNSGPMWPYGRRITTFPVWSHATGKQFPALLFQNGSSEDPMACVSSGSQDPSCAENNLSHPFNQSSRENHYCRPLMKGETSWDAATCATTAFTDKGRFSTSSMTGYPPRIDISRTTADSPSVDMFKLMNPFDAVSQATPAADGNIKHAPWPVPADLGPGDYVLYIEVAQESDFNATFNQTSYPSPAGIFWADYGQPFRGQPSIVYRVPFQIADTQTTASTDTYFGHGDPDGMTGTITPASPSDNITTGTPGTGAGRLQPLVGAGTPRVKVDVSPNVATQVPAAPTELQMVPSTTGQTTMSFVPPPPSTQQQTIAGYEIRIRANDEMTVDNFADSMPIATHVDPGDAGHLTFILNGLLPETDYWVGVRAYDGCANTGDLAITKITTPARISGAVDACFVATAAYGSVMANDVELLRHFRDSLLETNVLGELGVETYYTFGPALAGVVGESDLLRTTARDVLAPVIAWVRRLAF